jgi:hypothetical protein
MAWQSGAMAYAGLNYEEIISPKTLSRFLQFYQAAHYNGLELNVVGPNERDCKRLDFISKFYRKFIHKEIGLEFKCVHENDASLAEWRNAHSPSRQKWETFKARFWTFIGWAYGAKHLVGANDQTGVGNAMFGLEGLRKATGLEFEEFKLHACWRPLSWEEFCWSERCKLRHKDEIGTYSLPKKVFPAAEVSSRPMIYRWSPEVPDKVRETDYSLKLPTETELKYGRNLLTKEIILSGQDWETACEDEMKRLWGLWVEEVIKPQEADLAECLTQSEAQADTLIKRQDELKRMDASIERTKELAIERIEASEECLKIFSSFNALFDKGCKNEDKS